MFMNNSAI